MRYWTVWLAIVVLLTATRPVHAEQKDVNATVPSPPAAAPDPCVAKDAQIVNLKKENDDLHKQVDDSQKTVVDVRSQINAKDKSIADLQASLGDSARKIAALSKDLANKEAERQAKAQEVTTIQNSLLQVTRQATGLEKERDQLQGLEANLTAERDRIQSRLNTTLWRDAKEKDETKLALETKKSELTGIQTKLVKNQKDYEVSVAQTTELTTELKRTSSDLMRATDEVNTKEDEVKGLNKQLGDLRDSILRLFSSIVILFATVIIALLITERRKMRADVDKMQREALARDDAFAPRIEIMTEMRKEVFVHRALTVRLRKLIELSVVVTVFAGMALLVVAVVETHRSGASLAVFGALANDLFWKTVVGALTPLATLLLIYQAMLGKGVDTIAMCKELNIWPQPTSPSKDTFLMLPVAALRALPDDYLSTLPPAIADAIRARATVDPSG